MKIKNLAIIILMTTLFIILGTKVYATTGTINEDTVKLRKEPDSKTVLDYVYKDDEVEILELEDGWYKVKATTELGKVTGYIREDEVNVGENTTSSDTQEEQEPSNGEEESIQSEKSETEETISTDVSTETNISTSIEEDKQYTLEQEVSIKRLPLINSTEKAKITGDIKVIEVINDWVRVENDTESGWIRKNLLKKSLTQTETPVQEQPEDQPVDATPEGTTTEEQEVPEETNEAEDTETTTELEKIGYVNAEGLRVRKEPNTSSEELHSLSRNDKVEIIGQTGNWYKINLDGEIGYVSAKYISDTKVAETTSRSGSTLRNENITNETTATKEEITNVEETPAQTATETSTSGTTGAAVVEYAKQYLGYKYISGGTSPSTGFDCSGFTQYVYKHFGISINRTSGAQINNGVAVEKSDLQPGDLVIFNNDANTRIGHVGIYVGDGNFIHASNPSDGVKITTLTTGYYQKRYVGARRVF